MIEDDQDLIFKALADSTRRFLLDELFRRDGLTLTELESKVRMTRFGVMKHLRVLENAGLVVTEWSGREKRHFLNSVPIGLIHDRWIGKYRERHVAALVTLKNELENSDMADSPPKTLTIQVFRVFIRATPQTVWDAITRPEWTQKYGYGCPAQFDLRPGGAFRVSATPQMKEHGAGDVIIVGEVIESKPPVRLVQTWHPVWSPEASAEPHTRITYEILEQPGGVCRVTLTHDVTGAPSVGIAITGDVPNAGGGWSFVLSDMKTLLETGKGLAVAA